MVADATPTSLSQRLGGLVNRRDAKSARAITNAYLGSSAKYLPLVSSISVLTAAAQAFALVLLATAGLSLAGDRHTAKVSLGPLHLSGSPTQLTLLAIASAVVMGVLQMIAGRLAAVLAERAEQGCREAVVDAYLDSPWELAAQRERGELQQVLTNNVFRVSRAVVQRMVFAFGLINLVITLLFGFVASPLAALIMLGIGGLMALPLQPIKRLTQRVALNHGDAEKDYATFVAAMVEQSRESRVFNVGSVLRARNSALTADSADQQRRMQFLLWTTPALYLAGAMFALAAGVLVLAAFGSSNLTGIGTVIVLFLRSLSFLQIALAGLQYVSEAGPYLVGLEEQMALFRSAQRPAGDRDPGAVRTLTLDRVGYTYPGAARPALRDVTLTLSAGEMVGVVGPTGSGKSTLAEVLLRLRQPTSGSYLVNEVATADVSPAAWSRQIAYVPQQSVIIDGTIRDNIRYYREWITDEAVERAAHEANIHAEITAMPAGYDTVVSGLSVGLSGGQRQRLCIARALTGQPALLVMDEPTSGLDERSEAAFIGTIATLKGHATMVIVAHRLQTIAMCDRVVSVGEGAISISAGPAVGGAETGGKHTAVAATDDRGDFR